LENQEGNLIKDTCKSLGLTYRELGEKIGYSDSNLRKAVSQNKVSSQLKKAIELYLEIVKLKEKEEETKNFKSILRTFISKD